VICISSVIAHILRADPITIPTGMYEIKAETLLPNLREHLRHTITNSKQCLDTPDAFSLFPILGEVSFTDCDLVASGSGVGKYSLTCKNSQAASGDALFNISNGKFSAVLNIKMGGKNMKFSQKITAIRLGECEATR